MKLIEMATNPKFIMLIGAPGSGKSTWIENFVSSSPDEWVVLSTDEIIEKYAAQKGITYAEAFEELAFKNIQSSVNIKLRQSLNKKYNIILDQTNMTANSRRRKLSQVPDEYETSAFVFEIDRDELRRRGEKRKAETGKEVPERVIDNMINSYETPTKAEGLDNISFIRS